MRAYYNEKDPFAAEWLRQLIARNLIAAGDVDERSIEDVCSDDLKGYIQCHFFAGIGVWSYALRTAGWPDDRAVWTGSCPCQPFSSAGQGKGSADERHLWPAWFHLIRERRPGTLFGEQVASAIRKGWLDLVQDDLEGIGYAVGAVPFPACSVGAPHIRSRLYFVADALRGRAGHESREGLGAEAEIDGSNGSVSGERLRVGIEGATGILADSASRNASTEREQRSGEQRLFAESSATSILADASGRRCEQRDQGQRPVQLTDQNGEAGDMGDSEGPRLERHIRDVGNGDQPGRIGENATRPVTAAGGTNGFWRDAEWLWCRDQKYRPVEAGTFPLVNGTTNRVGKLRGYGNALVAPQAQAFIQAYLEL